MHKLFVNSVMVFLLCGCSVFAVHAQSDYTAVTDVAGFKSKLLKASANTKTIDCDFVQERNSSMLTKKITSKGHFWFKKPGFIRWEYTEPYSYLIILANKKVFVKDDSSRKQYDTQSNKMFKELGAMMFGFIQGNLASCEKDYTLEYFENGLNYYVKMIPKSTKVKETLSQVDLYFDKKDLSVSKIKMLEPGGDYTSIEFVNKILNKEIGDGKFSFK